MLALLQPSLDRSNVIPRTYLGREELCRNWCVLDGIPRRGGEFSTAGRISREKNLSDIDSECYIYYLIVRTVPGEVDE